MPPLFLTYSAVMQSASYDVCSSLLPSIEFFRASRRQGRTQPAQPWKLRKRHGYEPHLGGRSDFGERSGATPQSSTTASSRRSSSRCQPPTPPKRLKLSPPCGVPFLYHAMPARRDCAPPPATLAHSPSWTLSPSTPIFSATAMTHSRYGRGAVAHAGCRADGPSARPRAAEFRPAAGAGPCRGLRLVPAEAEGFGSWGWEAEGRQLQMT
jgi:hypothetical protein